MHTHVPMDKVQPFTSNSILVLLTSFASGVDLCLALCLSNSYPVSILSIATFE